MSNIVLKAFSIRDEEAEIYLLPFFLRTEGEAFRVFSDMLMNEEHQFNKHPRDFTLWYVGYYDQETGNLEKFEVHKKLVNGLDLKKAAIKERLSHEITNDTSVQQSTDNGHSEKHV